MDSLFFELPIGLKLPGNDEAYKDVELLSTNGVAEKIFLKKIAEKPFTWQGNVVSAAVKRIGNIEIGAEVRQKFLAENAVTIPQAVMKLTLADINTSLVEIHRRVWESFIPKQEIACKYCGKTLVADIDLDKIDFFEEDKALMDSLPDYSKIVVSLKEGFRPPVIPKLTDKEEYLGITDIVFNQMVFRPPLLEDAIKNEKYFSDSIAFWRRIAMDCLISIDRVEDGTVVDTLPVAFHTFYGLKIFNEHLGGKDLRTVRTDLTEYLPTLPFAYTEPCGCDLQKEIPMVMDVSRFFSE